MAYAEDTEVSVERSQAEIQKLLTKAGATRFMTGFDETSAAVMFTLRGKSFRFMLPLPNRNDKEFWVRRVNQHANAGQNTADEAYKKWEQKCRSRWRALALAIKAKLEAVNIGITTFEQEFLAFMMTDNGQTVGDRIIPQIEKSVKEGKAPQFLLGMGS